MLDSLAAYLELSLKKKEEYVHGDLLVKLNDYVEKQSNGAVHAVPARLEQDMNLFNTQRHIARAAEEIVSFLKDAKYNFMENDNC